MQGLNDYYTQISSKSLSEFNQEHNVKEAGLTTEEVAASFTEHGKNILRSSKPTPWYVYLFRSLTSPFNLVLFGISIVLVFTDVIFAEEPSFLSMSIILSIVFIGSLLDFVTTFQSSKSAEKLKSLISIKAKVIRNNTVSEIDTIDIAVHDIVKLAAGDMIPADMRIVESKDLYVSESSLTGESEPANKDAFDNNICYTGTNVISGYAKGSVLLTGDNTYFSKIAKKTEVPKAVSNFKTGISKLSILLARFMFVLIIVVFVISFSKHGLLSSFLFSVSIAIGLIPELLPVILSATMSKGAIQMSRKQTIVKKSDAIQTFGAMNILCTDKTGTLTEDRIVVEKYLNYHGEEDNRVLKHAFLNSFYQSGLKNNIDLAIINRVNTELEINNNEFFVPVTTNYVKVDEIPYDFNRRRLSVVVEDKTGKKQLITKGAIEEVLDICTFVDDNKNVVPFTEDIKNYILTLTKDLNSKGLRVLAVAQKKAENGEKTFKVTDEKDMVLIGFIGFLDPPKPNAKEAISVLNDNGIRVIVLTGDNELVTQAICNKIDINTNKMLLGSQIDCMSDEELIKECSYVNVFAKLSPLQKLRIVELLKTSGNTVGYMGDGINDAPALKAADVGISVDSAVDIAKETADIILLEKDLLVLRQGVLEGRKTFGNLLKYIKIAASFNFGEVTSVVIASIFLPFLPITPVQLLVQSLLYDIGQMCLPFDNVDNEYTRKPRAWNVNNVKKFMLWMGPVSTCFDLAVFLILWFYFKLGPDVAPLFQSIWFSYGIASNLIGLHVVRTSLVPFKESDGSITLFVFTITISIVACVVPFTALGSILGLVAIPKEYFIIIIGLPIIYCFVAQMVKQLYLKKNKVWM